MEINIFPDNKYLISTGQYWYKLTLKSDVKWLKDTTRSFPVTIDPPIRTSLDINSIHDTFIDEALPDKNYIGDTALNVWKNPSSGKSESYIMFDLPVLRSGSVVTNAELAVSLLLANFTITQVNVHKVNGNWYLFMMI